MLLALCASASAFGQPQTPGELVSQTVAHWVRSLQHKPQPLDLTLTGTWTSGKKRREFCLRLKTDAQGALAAEVVAGRTRVRAFRDAQRTLLFADNKHVLFRGEGAPGEITGCPAAGVLQHIRDGLPPALRAFANAPDATGGLVAMFAAAHVEIAGQDTIDAAACTHMVVKASAGIGRVDVWLSNRWPVRAAWASADGRDRVEVRLTRGGKELRPVVSEGTRTVAVSRSELDRTLVVGLSRAVLILAQRPLPAVPNPAPVEAGDGRLVTVAGKRVALLRGDHWHMGFQHGRLLGPQTRELVDTVLYTIGLYTSVERGEWFLHVLRQARSRTWPFTPECYRREMAGLAKGSGLPEDVVQLANIFPEYFHCSGFAVWGKATQGGALYHGRVLDYMRDIGLQRQAVIFVCKPQPGHAFVNVGYAGFVGSVTGMNDQQVAVGEMGGGGVGDWDGLPMALLVRRVLEQATTLDDALRIFSETPRTCEYYYVVSDGKIPSARGLVTAAKRFEVIEPNVPHPQLPTPVEDAVLLSARSRYKALLANVSKSYGKIDAAGARALVDRKVVIPNGNLHNVVFAPQTLELWVQDASGTRPAFKMPYAHLRFADLLRMMDQAPAAAGPTR